MVRIDRQSGSTCYNPNNRTAMDAERAERVERIFHLARGRDGESRSAFLADACGGDEQLRAEVDSLFAVKNDGPMRSPAQLQPGTRVGPYQLEAAIGAGGMGQVFRAHDTRLHRAVAIKFLLPERVADPSYKRRFLQEARAASSLNHPNIVALYDISNQDGRDFLVMEHVQGKTLTRLMEAGQMPVDDVVRLGEQVASALAAAHAVPDRMRQADEGSAAAHAHPAEALVDRELGLGVWPGVTDGQPVRPHPECGHVSGDLAV